MTWVLNASLRARLASNLTSFSVETIETDLRDAAVAIVVTDDAEGNPAILLTLRPARMGRHSNQYALPGGRMDEGETVIQTALRELHEELRIELTDEDVLGFLDDYQTVSGFVITPIVLWAGPAPEIVPDPVEVEKVFRIPFTELDSTAIPLLVHCVTLITKGIAK